MQLDRIRQSRFHDTEKQRVSEPGVPVHVQPALSASLFTARHSAIRLACPQGFREWIDPPAAITAYSLPRINTRESIQIGVPVRVMLVFMRAICAHGETRRGIRWNRRTLILLGAQAMTNSLSEISRNVQQQQKWTTQRASTSHF